MVGLAFADSTRLDIFVPCLVAIAIGGILNLLAAYSSSFLLPERQGELISTFSCTFDLSTIVFAVFNQLSLNLGLTRQELFLGYAAVVALAALPTLYLWGGLEPHVAERAEKVGKEPAPPPLATPDSKAMLSTVGSATNSRRMPLEHQTFTQQIRSPEYLFIIAYSAIEMFRANTYIGSVNELLDSYGDDEASSNHLYSRVFSYVLPAGIVCVPAIAWTMEQLGLTGSLLLTSLMGCMFAALSFVPNLGVQVLTFVVFTSFRAILYSVMNTFCAKTFGLTTCGRIIGSNFSMAALFGLLQYPLLNLTRSQYGGSFTMLNAVQTALTFPVVMMVLAIRRRLEPAPNMMSCWSPLFHNL